MQFCKIQAITFAAKLCFVVTTFIPQITSRRQDRITYYLYPAKKLSCPDDAAVNCSPNLIKEIADDAKYLPSASRLAGNFSLEPILKLFAKDHCHILVNNFQGIELSNSASPILIKKPTVGWLWRRQRNDKFKFPQSIWIPDEFSQRFANISSSSDKVKLNKSPHWSLISINFTQDEEMLDPDKLMRLKISSYWKKARPWQCEVNIYIFPPYKTLATFYLNIPSSFDYKFNYLSKVNIMPARVPQIQITVISKRFQSFDKEQIGVLIRKIRANSHRFGIQLSKVTNEVFFFVETTFSKRSHYLTNFINEHLIVSTRTLHSSHVINSKSELVEQLESINWLNNTDLEENWKYVPLVTLLTAEKKNMFGWYIHFEFYGTALDSTLQQMLSCEDTISREGYRWIYANFSLSPTILKAYAFAHILTSLMGNYTFRMFFHSHMACQNGKKVFATMNINNPIILSAQPRIFLDGTSTNMFPAVISGEPNYLRFISCGMRGMETFSIVKLLNVFDNSTWILLVLTLCIAPCVAKMVHRELEAKPMSAIDATIGFVKTLLEQGNPFPVHLMKYKMFCWIFVAFLLASIVLSNAFKGTSIYNVIVPSKVIGYQKLEDLVKDNFDVYVTSGKIYVRFSNLEQYEPTQVNCSGRNLVCWHDLLKIQGGNLIHVPSESWQLHYFTDDPMLSPEISVTSGSALEYLFNVTKLHGVVSELTEDMLRHAQNLARLDNKFWDSLVGDETLQGMIKTIKDKESESLFKSLDKCEKSAAILPLHRCNDWQKRLGRMGHPHVFVGRESYINSNTVFKLGGPVPQYIIEQFKSMHVSGIWNRWTDLTMGSQHYDAQAEKSSEPKKLSTSGNVAILFLLIPVGTGLAIFSLFLETVTHFVMKAYLKEKIIDKLKALVKVTIIFSKSG